jgi:hypothetical protein
MMLLLVALLSAAVACENSASILPRRTGDLSTYKFTLSLADGSSTVSCAIVRPQRRWDGPERRYPRVAPLQQYTSPIVAHCN